MLRLLSRLPSRRRWPADVLGAANAMLDILRETGEEANLIRLQRLLVVAQCRSLRRHGTRIHDADTIVMGDTPGMAEIHHAFRPFACRPITEHARHPGIDFAFPADRDEERLAIMREIAEECRGLSGVELGILLRRMLPNAVNGDVIPSETLGGWREQMVA